MVPGEKLLEKLSLLPRLPPLHFHQRHLFSAKLSTTKSLQLYQSVHADLPSLIFHSKKMASYSGKNARDSGLPRGHPANKGAVLVPVYRQLTYITAICFFRN
jgi:hypothetical protein